MTLATSQSNFRANMKQYMDHVVKENTPVYITRSHDTLVLETEEKYNLMYNYINYDEGKNGSLGKALLEEKLIDAGILPEPKGYSSAKEFMEDIFPDGF